ncbi:MAG TPA: 3-hydroxyacyl-CoA dehydrogenase NAD-binding domain-containing protein [Chthoniobacterales bacterium]|nr:3-hydroxyacyl-CoA dehydrogenase NAD-binding domain-containing protein [Chthoniobacterales bacterium]
MDRTITCEFRAEGIAFLIFDRPGSAANIFDQATFEQLNSLLDQVENDSSVRGLVIVSAKPKIFIAGADLSGFSKDPSPDDLAKIIDLGQRTFDRIANLKFPTVAAIHGVALGGGLEIALACDYRIASLDSATKVGLPETTLGIIPAWGGCTRLPRLVGLPVALEVILSGKQIPARQAQKLGLVDDSTYRERLEGLATKKIVDSQGRKRVIRTHFSHIVPLATIIADRAKKKTIEKTRGHYPAPLKALEVVVSGLNSSTAVSQENEKKAFIELTKGEVAQNLIRVFFLQERAKKLTVGDLKPEVKPKRVLVVGAGLMGSGIAQWLSARGFNVVLKDIGPEPLGKGLQSIDRVYRDAVKRRILSEVEARAGFDRILPIYEDVPLTNIDLAIEAAVEKLDLKKQIFSQLEPKIPNTLLIASNTSGLSIDAISEGLAHPEKIVGVHFFNPVHRMQLVEVVRGSQTSETVLAMAIQFVKSIGKLPVLVKDSPGFLVNRILLPYLVEAIRIFSEGHSVESIDRAILGFGMPMGPLRLNDEVGLDVSQHVGSDLAARVAHLPPLNDVLPRMIQKGWLGRKSGAGFYVYRDKSETPNPELKEFQPSIEPTNADQVTDRLIFIMVNEAARVLEENVVTDPADVDFGMIMGTGWAPFRGGPLKYADSVGISTVVSRLNHLAEKFGEHFKPCALLNEMVNRGVRFFDAKR